MEEELVIHKIFAQIVSAFSDRVALQIKTDTNWQRFTYKEIETSALKVGAFLLKEGFKKSDFAVLILENRPEWAIIYLGIICASLVCVPLDPQLTEQEIENLINDCGAKIIFVSHSVFLKKNIQKIKQNLHKIIILDLEIDEDNLKGFSQIKTLLYEDILWPSVLPQDIASLIYTSGTTAKPKGVLLSHYNLCSNVISIKKLNLILPLDNFLSILPLYHTYAFMVTLLVPLLTGAKVTYCASFKPEDLSQLIKEANVTILVGVPQLFSMVHKAIFERIKKIPFFLRPGILPFIKTKVHRRFGKSLRLLVSGGARLEPGVGRDLSKLGFKVIEGYGLTETSPVVTLNPSDKIKFGSVGKPIPGVEVEILYTDKSRPFELIDKAFKYSKGPGESEIGEVLIKGPNVMQGYYKQQYLTNEVIKEGWFYSGDLGYKDSEGYLFLVGRKKDVIVLSSGKNIYPEELEEVYGVSPYIKEICILNKAEEKFGRPLNSLYAIIVPDLEYFRLKNEKNIRERIRWALDDSSKSLPGYKHIMGFIITKEELPRTRLRKIKRYEVAQKYLKEEVSSQEIQRTIFSEEDLKILNMDIAQKIINYLSSELKRPVSLDNHLEIDLGIDSLSRVELGLGLEALLSLKIPDNLIDSISTVREVIMNIQNIIDKTTTEIYVAQKEQKTWGEILKESPSDAVLKKIRITTSLLDKIIVLILKNILLFLFKVFWFLRIEREDRLPLSGSYILCPNHASYLDGFFIFSSLPIQSAINIFFLGHAAIFKHPLVSWAVKIARLISIDPSTHLTEAMQAAAYVLRHKKVICIFPEGGRSISDRIGEFKRGIGILVKELNVWVIPVYIKGSHYSWPRGSRFPHRYPVKIIFGRPFAFKELKEEGLRLGAKDEYEAIALGIRQEVLMLCNVNKNAIVE